MYGVPVPAVECRQLPLHLIKSDYFKKAKIIERVPYIQYQPGIVPAGPYIVG